ncbi:MAG: hypothetical protein ACFFBH_00800 [Promethearchaeota archaeon]
MEKIKLKRLVLSIILITVVFSLIPAAVAYGGKESVNIRPIEDWLIPVVEGDLPLGGMPDYDKGLIIWPFLDDPATSHWACALDYNPEGFVLERELKNNIMLITIHMSVKDAPFYITNFVTPIPIATLIFKGTLDFTYELKFTIDLNTLGPDDYDEDGDIIYHTWDYYVWQLGNFESVFLCGHGSGEFLNSFDDWEEGDTAKMHTVNNIVKVGEDYTGPNPYYNFLGLLEITLADNINFH